MCTLRVHVWDAKLHFATHITSPLVTDKVVHRMRHDATRRECPMTIWVDLNDTDEVTSPADRAVVDCTATQYTHTKVANIQK